MKKPVLGVLGATGVVGRNILEILEAKDRRKAGITAPPEGLYLNDVYYRWMIEF